MKNALEKEMTCVAFGQWVRAAREKQGLYQLDVADHIGVTQSHYARMERGERSPNFIQALEICKFLKIDINDFMRTLQWNRPLSK